tara:strand:- start:594 stop:737 length:144 start_codon:yes stop_codon:yes gene_type:complete
MAEPNKQFDFNWNWPEEDIEVKSSANTKYVHLYAENILFFFCKLFNL